MKLLRLSLFVIPFMFFASCEPDSPVEKAADDIEEATDDAGDAAEDAGDAIEEKVDEIAD